MNKNLAIMATAVTVAALAGCIPQGTTRTPEDTGAAQENRLPVSLNEVMVALVNNAADPIWVAAWRHPESDEVWRALERNAYQLEIAGSLLTVPGTGPLDVAWTNDPKWQFYSEQLESVGGEARVALENRDLDAIKLAGDKLVEVCEGCHIDFKPADPTAGKFGELSPTEADFEDD